MANMRYLIEPYNEGQSLNYSEIQDFPSDKHARIYAREMKRKLSIAMIKGMISVRVEKII